MYLNFPARRLALCFSLALVALLGPLSAGASANTESECPGTVTAVIDPQNNPGPVNCDNMAGGSMVTLDGTGSTTDPAIHITYQWTAPGVTLAGDTTLMPTGTFPLGTTTVTLRVECDDGLNGVVFDETTFDVVVADTTPPSLMVIPDKTCLWPPNHKYHKINVTLVAMDACDPDPDVVLTCATSSEPDNSNGDGNTVNDVQGADTGTEDTMLMLRSERRGPGSGREYNVCYRATDGEGNFTDAMATISVPHDMRPSNRNGCDLQNQTAKQAAKAAAKAAKAADKAARKAAKAAAKAAKRAAKANK